MQAPIRQKAPAHKNDCPVVRNGQQPCLCVATLLLDDSKTAPMAVDSIVKGLWNLVWLVAGLELVTRPAPKRSADDNTVDYHFIDERSRCASIVMRVKR